MSWLTLIAQDFQLLAHLNRTRLSMTWFALLMEEKQPNDSWFFPPSLTFSSPVVKVKRERKKTLLYQFLSHFFLSEMSSGGSQHSSLPRQQLAEKSYCCQIPSLPREQTGRSEDRERIKSRELKQKGYKTLKRRKKKKKREIMEKPQSGTGQKSKKPCKITAEE